MKWVQSFILWVVLTVTSLSTTAQTNVNSWFRLTGHYRLTKRITGDFELQHRRQDDYSGNNPLRHNLLYSVRPWFYYSLHENVRIDVSPLAYYSLYSLTRESASIGKSPLGEYRNSLGINFKYPLASRLAVVSRSMVEYRNFTESASVLRFRQKLGLEYDLGSRYKMGIQHELLLNLVGTHSSHFYDHQRLSVFTNKKLSKYYGVELGYLFISRLPPKDATLRKEHNLYLNVTIDLTSKTRKI